MKLNELRSKAGEKLEEGKRAKDGLENSKRSLERSSLSREEKYDFMADAMEVDEDFRPKGDIVSANEAFERSKAEEQSFREAVDRDTEILEGINAQKRETIAELETYIENNEKYMESLSGAKDNKFGHTLEPLEEAFNEHIAEAEGLRDELLQSLDEGAGGHAGAGDSFGAGAGDSLGAGAGDSFGDGAGDTLGVGFETGMDVSGEGLRAGAEGLSDEDRAWQAEMQRRRSEAFRQKVMSDPMTKNPLFSGVRAPAGAGGPSLTFGINDERLSGLSYAQGNNTLGWGNDCSLAQVANIMTLAGIPTAEEQVVNHVNAIRGSLKGNPASSGNPFMNGGMVPDDISRVLSDFGLANDVYEDRSGLVGGIRKMFGAKDSMDLDTVATAVEDGKGVILGVNASLLNGRYGDITANHAISVVGTARDLTTHEVVGFYINDTGHPDAAKDGRLERSQTKFVPLWRMRQAYEVPNAAAIVTRGRIR